MLSFIYMENWTQALDRYIEEHPRGNIFQSGPYLSIHLDTKNLHPFTYAVLEGENKIEGLVSGIVYSNYTRPLNALTRRAVISGGPLIRDEDPEVLEFLLDHLIKALRTKCVYSQFRNLWDQTGYSELFRKKGYQYEPHLDILIDLNKDIRDIRSGISRNKRRNVVKSKNKGCYVREISDREEFQSCLALITQTYSRVNLPLPDRKLFFNAFDILGPMNQLKCFGLFFTDLCIGIRMELIRNGTIYDWYAGSDHNYKSMYPNDHLIFHIIEWGNRQNHSLFRFGGAGKPGIPYGVRDHKHKFGGDLVEYGRYGMVHKKLFYFIGKLGHRILHRKA